MEMCNGRRGEAGFFSFSVFGRGGCCVIDWFVKVR